AQDASAGRLTVRAYILESMPRIDTLGIGFKASERFSPDFSPADLECGSDAGVAAKLGIAKNRYTTRCVQPRVGHNCLVRSMCFQTTNCLSFIQ
ncbi:MAG TPA: hypothetical protein VHJ19_08125, partial [Gammaproteobacteria bacterium]|nr:hypothetical protein [Gammaproteobacteria bacterium]